LAVAPRLNTSATRPGTTNQAGGSTLLGSGGPPPGGNIMRAMR